MPNSGVFWGEHLSAAVANGSVSTDRIDDMATRFVSAESSPPQNPKTVFLIDPLRIIATWCQMGQDREFPVPGVGMPVNLSLPHEIVDGRDPQDGTILFQGAVEGHVLVKNINNALPLQKPKTLSIVGYSAKAPDQNMPGGAGFSAWTLGYEPFATVNITAIFSGEAGAQPQIASGGTLLLGGGSGATSQSTFISPFDGLVARADADYTQLFWDFSSPAPSLMGDSDACLVFTNAFASEGFDRAGVRDDYTDGLILSVASRCANTIVIMHNAGTRLVDQWVDHPNVTAVVFAHLPGQDTGKALVSLLYGMDNFSGKLPYTVARNESDYGDLLSPAEPEGQFARFPQSNFDEGVYIDYRRFDKAGIVPRFEFGFGLSYTTFNYSCLTIKPTTTAGQITAYPTGAVQEGGQTDLWDIMASVSARVANTGDTDGAEVAQLYVGIPGAPAKQLRGFEKPFILSGASATVNFGLTRRDLSVWDAVAQKWLLQSGDYQVYVGSSSRNLPLNGVLTLASN